MSPREIALIAIEAYRAAGLKVAEIGSGDGGRFFTFHVTGPNGVSFTVQVEEVW